MHKGVPGLESCTADIFAAVHLGVPRAERTCCALPAVGGGGCEGRGAERRRRSAARHDLQPEQEGHLHGCGDWTGAQRPRRPDGVHHAGPPHHWSSWLPATVHMHCHEKALPMAWQCMRFMGLLLVNERLPGTHLTLVQTGIICPPGLVASPGDDAMSSANHRPCTAR